MQGSFACFQQKTTNSVYNSKFFQSFMPQFQQKAPFFPKFQDELQSNRFYSTYRWSLLVSFLKKHYESFKGLCLRPGTLLKKSLWHRCFSVNFEISKRTFFTQHPRTTASTKILRKNIQPYTKKYTSIYNNMEGMKITV